ncbi:ribonuclease P protein component [Microbacterium oryzae]|uniref:Ribonuclease P protein component n=1 Tax=Microbacterium oryzae TaxID=743009 RepID=A0A6I6DZ70_9MICO|nr:ribonuclease P protein component [Microbacterium oryzae]QGU28063.1 ribonuclease P protein component [Microbacterium oryzae]
MLARPHRLVLGADYRMVVRRGSRCAGASTVTHVVHSHEERAPRFGFIVSKAVGNAVTRNTVRRRLKAVCAEALPGVRPGADVVIRALPSAAQATFQELRSEVTRCLARKAAP